MGMFDTVWVNCPKCGENIEFQSKAGECYMHDYTLSTAPPAVLGDLDGESETCRKCGTGVRMRAFVTVSAEIVSTQEVENVQ